MDVFPYKYKTILLCAFSDIYGTKLFHLIKDFSIWHKYEKIVVWRDFIMKY